MSTHISTKKLKTPTTKNNSKFNPLNLDDFIIETKYASINKTLKIKKCWFQKKNLKEKEIQDQYLFKIQFENNPIELICFITTWKNEKLNNAKNIILHAAKIINNINTIEKSQYLKLFKILFDILEEIILNKLKAESVTYTIALRSNVQQNKILLTLLSKKYKIVNRFVNKNSIHPINVLHKYLERK